MNHELAQQLKDAGFPLRVSHNTMTVIDAPSLSELIEACGEGIEALQREHIEEKWKWCAVKEWEAYYPPEVLEGQYGSTPEEAVARLWLALNTEDHE